MTLQFFNTLTRKKEPFQPLRGKVVRMYSCGPTVYNFVHIGNIMAYTFADLLRRYLTFKGYDVIQVMNLTDVDDKTIKKSKEEKVPLNEVTERYSKAFFEDVKAMNILPASIYTKATDHIKEMVEITKQLLEKGVAYKGKDGSIYFSISKFPAYGELAHLDLKGLKAGARVKQDEYTKDEVQDFALWKAWDKDDGDVFWETELGKGRPGWHIECSAMSMKYLGHSFDIHTGGVDLIFPHHQNEIAQSEGSTGKKFVNFWLHNEHLMVDGKKMSKSLKNFYTLRDLEAKGTDLRAFRYLLLSAHYRKQLNFTFEGLDAAKNSLDRLDDFIRNIKTHKGPKNIPEFSELTEKCKEKFEQHMDDDLNVPEALAVVFEFVREVNRIAEKTKLSEKNISEIVKMFERFDSVLGLDIGKEKVVEGIEEKLADLIEELSGNKARGDKDSLIQELIKLRQDYREKKEFKKADLVRDKLKEIGILLEDESGRTGWKVA
ncbi:MAG: cysteine--tRNA ligase [Candidatus Aenigmarchaeota archaeon]|nr:cysteine--tRNA ligase [Candidatus Aenigmarchaeota archaeon]